MKTENIKSDHPVALHHAVDVLKNGGLVAFPTDTVYGLASDPFDELSVERLFIAKGRNSDRAIAILIGDPKDLNLVSSGVGEVAWLLIKHYWPGPLTLVVPGNPSLPQVLSPNKTIGVRMPDHPVVLELLRQIGPLAVTSANLTGQKNANTAQEVMDQLSGRIHLIIDGGRTGGGVPSTVVDCVGAELKVLREGPISLEDMQRTISGVNE